MEIQCKHSSIWKIHYIHTLFASFVDKHVATKSLLFKSTLPLIYFIFISWPYVPFNKRLKVLLAEISERSGLLILPLITKLDCDIHIILRMTSAEYNSDNEVIGDNYNPLYENPLLVSSSRQNVLETPNNNVHKNSKSSQILPSQYNQYAQMQYQQQQQQQLYIQQQQQQKLQHQQQLQQQSYQSLFQQQPQQISVMSMSHTSHDSLSDILPIGWARLKDKHGNYYVNIMTHHTQREIPTTDALADKIRTQSDATAITIDTVSTTYSAFNNNTMINNPNRNAEYASPIAHNTTIELNINESYSLLSDDIPDIPKSIGVASGSEDDSEGEYNELRIDNNHVSIVLNDNEWSNAVVLDDKIIIEEDKSPSLPSPIKNKALAALSNIFTSAKKESPPAQELQHTESSTVDLLDMKTMEPTMIMEPAPMVNKQNSNLIFRQIASIGNEKTIHTHLMFDESWDILVDSMQQNIPLDRQLIAFNALKKIAENLKKDDAKYRILYNDNNHLQTRILEHVGGYEFLLGLGFKENDIMGGQLICKVPDTGVINTALRALNKRIYLLSGSSHEFMASGKNIDLENKPIRFEAIFDQMKEENNKNNAFDIVGNDEEAREKAEMEMAIKMSNKQNKTDLIEQQARALADANARRDSKKELLVKSVTPYIPNGNEINFTSSEDESDDNDNEEGVNY